MLKLIASRLENVFLNANGEFNARTFQRELDTAQQHGTRFVLLSGWPYSALLNKFQVVTGPLDYVAENGAQVVCRGVNIREHFVNSAAWDRAYQWLKKKADFGSFKVILSGRDGAFTDLRPADPRFKKWQRFDPALNPVPDLSLVGDPVYQVNLLVTQPNVTLLIRMFDKKFHRKLRALPGGPGCLKIVSAGVNLAHGLNAIQKHVRVRIRQTAAFGRYLRDFNVLNSAKYAYYVTGARPELADVAKPLNSSGGPGVVKQIDRLLKLK